MLCNFIQVREHISLLLYYGRLPIGKKKYATSGKLTHHDMDMLRYAAVLKWLC